MTDEMKPAVEESGLAALEEFREEAERSKWYNPVPVENLLARPPVVRDWFLAGCFKARDKVEIVGPSKIGKTWFLLGLAVHLAAGRPFLGIAVPRKRRVLYVNLEVPEDDLQVRLQGDGDTTGMLAAYGINPAEVAGQLTFVCCRGFGGFVRTALDGGTLPLDGADVVVIDPKYTLMKEREDENSAVGLAPLLASFSRLANQGPAVVYVTHDGKGFAGERSTVDRGAGSGITGRDFDCRICLTRHAASSEDDPLVVAQFSCRAAKPPADKPLRFNCPALAPCPDIPAEVETQATRTTKGRPDTPPFGCDAVRRILKTEPAGLSRNAIVARVECGKLATEYAVKRALPWMVRNGELTESAGERKSTVYRLVSTEKPVGELASPTVANSAN
jgi:hypothetical protein